MHHADCLVLLSYYSVNYKYMCELKMAHSGAHYQGLFDALVIIVTLYEHNVTISWPVIGQIVTAMH